MLRTLAIVIGIAVTIASSTSLCAQSPLSLPFAANNGLGAGAQVFFDLTVLDPSGVTITRLDVNCGASVVGTIGTVEVYTTPATYVGKEFLANSWTLAASGGVVAQGDNVPSPTCLGSGIFLPQGAYGIAVRHVGVALRYTNGGGSVPSTASTTELAFQGGASQATPWTSTPFTPRIFNGNIHYNVGNVPATGCASSSTFGEGCYEGAYTWYELFGSLPSFDLVGSPGSEQVLLATPIGPPGYLVVPAAAAWQAPAGTQLLNNAATPAQLGDDHLSQPLTLPFAFPFPGGSTTVVHAAANGYVLLGSTTSNSADLSPTVAELTAQAPRLCALWCDLHPTANLATNPQSGVYFQIEPGNQSVYITWRDVGDGRGGTPAAGTTSVNVQCVLRASGDYEFRYGVVTPGSGTGPVIVGWSQGNAFGGSARDPGGVDLSASLPLLTDGPDSDPLQHSVGLPRLGTNLALSVASVENLAPLAFLIAGDTALDPGLALTTLGAPGCSAYTNLQVLTGVAVTQPAGTGTFTLAVPNNAALIGATFASQYAALTLRNALNLVTSNGASWTIGN